MPECRGWKETRSKGKKSLVALEHLSGDIFPQLVGKCAMKPATVSGRAVAFNRNTA